MNLVLVTRALTRGGAQMQVAELAEGLARRGHSVSVATFYSGGPLHERLEAAGVPIVPLGKSARWNLVDPVRRLRAHLQSGKCEIAYSFLPMENLLGLFASRMSGVAMVWGLRGATVNRTQYGYASRLLYSSQFALVRQPDAVISNSRAALAELADRRLEQVFVVPNGIDCRRFVPDATRRRAFRDAHRIDEGTPLIGIVARLDPMKDHITFFRAAAIVRRQIPQALFAIAGDGPSGYRRDLEAAASALELTANVMWLGDVTDPAQLYNALDVVVSSSAYGEGFSNVIGEAMASGRPVVATDVGDSAHIVSDLGSIVRPCDPEALARAIAGALSSDSALLRERRRARIVDEFDVDAMVSRTEAILRGVVERRRTATPAIRTAR